MVFTGGNFHFFHAHIFRFHGWDLAENFTGTVDFSRAVSKKFSREGNFFHGRKSKNFHGKDFFFFTGKKKHWSYLSSDLLDHSFVIPSENPEGLFHLTPSCMPLISVFVNATIPSKVLFKTDIIL